MENLYLVCLPILFFSANAQYSLLTSAPFATRDQEFILTCSISNSETSAATTWSRNSVSVVNIRISKCFEGDTGQGLFNLYRYNCTTSSRRYNLIIPTPRINNEADSRWYCGPSGGGSYSNFYTLQFYTPPTGSPVITGYDGSTRFFGNTVVLTCTVTGGIPLATLSLTCKDTPVPGTVLGTMTYTVSIDSSYNGQRCSCTASHPTWTVNKGVHSQMFVVHYPPTVNPLVSGYDGSVRYRGDRVTLTCQVSGGSPLATLPWTCDGQPQNVNPSISGTTVTSVLTLILQKGHNGKTCTCHGRHSDTRYTPYISSRTFIVYYPPSVPGIYTSTSTPFPWIEAGNGTLECKSQPGNPSTITYQWIRENVVIQGQTGDSLVITSLTRNDNKNSYKCKVSNDCTVHKNEDLMSRPTVLDVEYPPSIPAIQFPSSVKEGEEVTMVCRAQGVPDQYIYNGWTQIYRNQIIRSTNDFSTLSQNKRNLTLSGVSYQDIGTYRCSANNGIPDKDGEPNQTDEKYLNIEFSAVFNSSTKFYSELNRTVEIKIPFLSNPPAVTANISLTKNNINQISTGIPVAVRNRNLDINFHGKDIKVSGQEVVVTLHSFSIHLQGNYTIGVKNVQGGTVSTFVFEVVPSGPPETPMNFGILSITSNSITVTWLRGLNRGHKQTFVLSYKRKDSKENLLSEEIEEEYNRENYTLRIKNLLPQTENDFWLFSYNIKGNSTNDLKLVSQIITKTTGKLEDFQASSFTNGLAIGIVIGFMVGILTEGLIISFLLWRKGICNECKG